MHKLVNMGSRTVSLHASPVGVPQAASAAPAKTRQYWIPALAFPRKRCHQVAVATTIRSTQAQPLRSQ